MRQRSEVFESRKAAHIALWILLALVVIAFFGSFFVGYAGLSFTEVITGLFQKSNDSVNRIMLRLRLPCTLAAFLIGGGLGLAGLMMQTALENPMASPVTLGVSNAATFGANLFLLIFYGTSALGFSRVASQPLALAGFAFLFALLSIGVSLWFSSFHRFEPTTVVLVGIAMASFFQALTTICQFLAEDNTLSALVGWSFGNLERLNLTENGILAAAILPCLLLFWFGSSHYDALLCGEDFARSVGVKVSALRMVTLLLASLIAALAVSFCGIIGFVGIVAPHLWKRFFGYRHRTLIPGSFLLGALLLLACDMLTRCIGRAANLPVGAITALFGAPAFLLLFLVGKRGNHYVIR